MSDITRILSQFESGDPSTAEQLLPLVYDELRKLAALRMVQEKSDRTLQATALVHEAYIRLVGSHKVQHWDSRGHFFSAAAEAMRRILVDNARRRKRLKHGGQCTNQDLIDVPIALPGVREDLLALDAALERLKRVDSQAAELIQLRYFAGLSLAKVAEILGISPRSADRVWAFARAWLHREITGGQNQCEE